MLKNAVFQILILGKENISLILFVSGIKLDKILFSFKKLIDPKGISKTKIEEIKTRKIKNIKKIVLILNPINNVEAIEKFVIAFLDFVKKIAIVIDIVMKIKKNFFRQIFFVFSKKNIEKGKIAVSQVPA